jgi:ring-1,2-phenylacetyl-CoA epoxidase subunit PaaD
VTTIPVGRPRSADDVMAILHEVKDPEVPAIDVVELGIVRSAVVEGDRVTVQVTPTYSGCPATKVIEREIEAALRRHGVPEVTVHTVFHPPWTTDWITEEAREKLRVYGIAPPGKAPGGGLDLVSLGGPTRTVACPYCGSSNTVRESEFGSTACKSIHSCLSCHQPFEHFKAI